jgi:uncharacterized protein (DUF2235 family)
VLFSDGTGNSPAKLVRTNVWRVYQAVDLADPQDPKEPRQFAFYDDGVGSSSWKPLALLGGAMGLGLARNVRDLYTFLCRTYRPGDKIYAFGFSRGAFTIRVLVALVMDQGLVPYNGNEADLARHVASAYRAFRAGDPRLTLLGWVHQFRIKWTELKDRLLRRRLYRDVPKIGSPSSQEPIQIEFIGVWDTVDAYGLPVDEFTRAIDRVIFPITMRDLNLHWRVNRARHALSLDDERNTFHPRLWNEEHELLGNRTTTHVDQERISQVWFAGVHANVGGGYPDDTLAHVSLDWIMMEANKDKAGTVDKGLRFQPNIWEDYRALSDENGPIHNSRHGLGGYYRYNPRRIEKLTHRPGVVIPRTKVHESVFRRIQVGLDSYAPIVLPTDFAVVRIDGSIMSGDDYLETDVSQHFGARQEHVWNWVWRRRVVYFLTLFLSLFLALTPLIWTPLPKGACTSNWCFLSDAIAAVAGFLPGFTATWTDTFASHPGKFLAVATLIGLGLWRGGRLESRIRDAMRPLWYSLPATRPRAATLFLPPEPLGRLNRCIEWLRTRPTYQRAFQCLSQVILPGVFLVGANYLVGALINKVVFEVANSTGGICRSRGEHPRPVLTSEQAGPFSTSDLCSSTGLLLAKGSTYRLRMVIPAAGGWADNGIPAGPNGVHPGNVSLPMSLGTPLRRYLTQPWFKPIARIGDTGTDEYPLDGKPSVAFYCRPLSRPLKWWEKACPDAPPPNNGAADETFETEIIARSDGELFLYVNDAVLVPPWREFFYSNNIGSAQVSVERLLPASRTAPEASPKAVGP